MCWWTQFGDRIKNVDDCRNLSAIIFQHYKGIIGTPLQSIVNRNNVKIPHFINHYDRRDFISIIAVIVGDDKEEKTFDTTREAVERLKKYEPLYSDIRDSEMLAKILSIYVTKDSENTLPDSICSMLQLFAAAVTASMRAYNKTGPDGLYSIKYLYELL
jgi:hypothetical protein